MHCSDRNRKNSRRHIMNQSALTYWVAFGLIPEIWTKRKNEIYAKCFQHEPSISIVEFFEGSTNWDIVGLSDRERELMEEARNQLPNYSFMVEEMTAQGYDIIPITSLEYPRQLKVNLKYNAPIVIYTKGNKELLQEQSIAIVGSRSADNKSLQFTDHISRKSTGAGSVVVSGFAKGVDRQALDSAVESGGKSIIVLPQGIMTFGAGFKQYYRHIIEGKVLVMSTFAPRAPWSVELAMARNPIIYGMASEIYVAQSDDKGGTWAGVTDGLRKNRTIYVRYPEKSEKNANMLLIQKGATAVDIEGNILALDPEECKTPEQRAKEKMDSEIISILKRHNMVAVKELLELLDTTWKEDKMKRYLENMEQVEKTKIKNRVYYRMKGKIEESLFGDSL